MSRPTVRVVIVIPACFQGYTKPRNAETHLIVNGSYQRTSLRMLTPPSTNSGAWVIRTVDYWKMLKLLGCSPNIQQVHPIYIYLMYSIGNHHIADEGNQKAA